MLANGHASRYRRLMAFSDYVVFVDESGDHGLKTINPEYPVFVLAFCICRKDAYVQHIVPLIHQLKFDFWGHDAVVLHSHEIRKSKGDFAQLLVPEIRAAFQERITAVMQEAEFTLIAAVINKEQLVRRYAQPNDPYEIALAFCAYSDEAGRGFRFEAGRHSEAKPATGPI